MQHDFEHEQPIDNIFIHRLTLHTPSSLNPTEIKCVLFLAFLPAQVLFAQKYFLSLKNEIFLQFDSCVLASATLLQCREPEFYIGWIY